MDSDSGVYGNVSFELLLPAQDSALWEVRTTENGRGQLVAIGNLDRETVSNYVVPISARDGGNPAATATTIVRVTVLDVNDNRPQLNRVSYNASVIENSAMGQVIARVSESLYIRIYRDKVGGAACSPGKNPQKVAIFFNGHNFVPVTQFQTDFLKA